MAGSASHFRAFYCLRDVRPTTIFNVRWSKLQSNIKFNNDELERILRPLFYSSPTWKEFMKRIEEIWQIDKCKIIYPWYKYAILEIFGGDISQYWEIELKNIPIVPYRVEQKGIFFNSISQYKLIS